MVETIINTVNEHDTIRLIFRGEEDSFLLEVKDDNYTKCVDIDLDLDAMQCMLQSIQALILIHNQTLATKT